MDSLAVYQLFLHRLPIDTATGEAVYAEASLKGKKKDAVVMCALNACRMLDAQDMLRHHAKGMIALNFQIFTFHKTSTWMAIATEARAGAFSKDWDL